MKNKLLTGLTLLVAVLPACGKQEPKDPLTEMRPVTTAQDDKAQAKIETDALTDADISALEQEQAQLENELSALTSDPELERYSAVVARLLAGEQELPDLGDDQESNTGKGMDKGADPGKGKGQDPSNACSKKCVIMKDIAKAIKAGDCEQARELIERLKEEVKDRRRDCEHKIRKCRDRIAKAKACREKTPGKGEAQEPDSADGSGKGSTPVPDTGKGSTPSKGKG